MEYVECRDFSKSLQFRVQRRYSDTSKSESHRRGFPRVESLWPAQVHIPVAVFFVVFFFGHHLRFLSTVSILCLVCTHSLTDTSFTNPKGAGTSTNKDP